MLDTLNSALDGLDIQPRDQAVVRLAQQYASSIDTGESDLTKLGPALQSCLETLLLSPRARAMATKGGAPRDPDVANPADELRAKRAARTG